MARGGRKDTTVNNGGVGGVRGAGGGGGTAGWGPGGGYGQHREVQRRGKQGR